MAPTSRTSQLQGQTVIRWPHLPLCDSVQSSTKAPLRYPGLPLAHPEPPAVPSGTVRGRDIHRRRSLCFSNLTKTPQSTRFWPLPSSLPSLPLSLLPFSPLFSLLSVHFDGSRAKTTQDAEEIEGKKEFNKAPSNKSSKSTRYGQHSGPRLAPSGLTIPRPEGGGAGRN